MTSFSAGDLVLVAFPFVSGAQSKVRPALVLLDNGDADILVARVTSQSAGIPQDVPLTDWQQAGLLVPSTARLHKLATLEKAQVYRILGHLGMADRQAVSAVLRQTFGGLVMRAGRLPTIYRRVTHPCCEE